jgi:hypothetical protein
MGCVRVAHSLELGGGRPVGMVVDRSVSSGLFVSIQTKGPTLITGGAFGPEGGLSVTAVLLIGISVVVIRIRAFGGHSAFRQNGRLSSPVARHDPT